MNKKLYILTSVFALLSMLLASCGGGQPAASAEPEVLRVWIQWGDNPQQIQELFDKYTAETGIKVEVTAPLEEDKILPALTGSEPPDVLVLATMMLPFQVTMIPVYLLFNDYLGWGDTFLPLIVPAFFANAWDVFLLRQFFKTIPEEMCDAARVDGASEWQIFTRIILPLSVPVLATVSVFTFLWAWNDFTGPLLFLTSPKNFTMALGLQDFQSQRTMIWNQLMAAATVFTVPIVIAFFFAQKTFIQGIKLTGSKE